MKPVPRKIKVMSGSDAAMRSDADPFALPMPVLSGRPAPLGERVRRLVELGDREMARARFGAALDHYREAGHLVSDADGAAAQVSPEDRRRLAVRSARCLLRLGHPTEALQAVEAAAAMPGAADDPAGAALLDMEIALQWGEVYVELGDYRRAEEHAAEGRELLESLFGAADDASSARAAWAGRLHNLLGHIAARSGSVETAESEFGAAVAFHRRAGDLVGLAQAFNNLGLAAKNRCQWTRAREYLTVSERLRSEGEEDSPHGGSPQNLGIVHLKLGEWASAEECFQRSLELSTRRGDTQNQVRANLALGDLFRMRREFARAEESLTRAVALAETHQYLRELAIGWKLEGELAADAGRLRDAGEYYDRAEAIATHIAPSGDLVIELTRLRAETAVALGEAQAAMEQAQRALALAGRQGDVYEEALALAALARAYDLAGEPGRAHQAHVQATDRLRELGARYPLAWALVAAAAHLRAASPERNQARLYLREARARLEECGDPLGPALVGLESARLEIAAGHLDQAVEMLGETAAALRGAGRPRDLDSLGVAERELEDALVSQALAARRVTHRARGESGNDLVTPERLRHTLSSVVDALKGSTGADGVLLAIRPGGSGPLELLVHAGISDLWAAALIRAIPQELDEAMAGGAPLVVLDAARPGAISLPAGTVRREVASLIVVPLRLAGGVQGFMYLDRLSGSERLMLAQKDLNLALAVTEELASLVGELELCGKTGGEPHLGEMLRERIAFADVVTQNREMYELLRLAGRVASTRLTVLIQGETGTGKQLVARAIHASSDRRDRSFVTIDCAALPENLLESELFGYRRGAFTGATSDRKGLVEEADGGTIFLDEIGRAGLGIQQRLLHLLDCGEIRAVGATTYRQMDVRVISATSTTDLRREVEEGRFLKDLYYRLNDFAVTVPPLRERREDILLLSQYFLELFATECKRPVPEVSRPALRLLLEYEWPGNVRELQKVVRRAAVLADDGEAIAPEHLPVELRVRERVEEESEEWDEGDDAEPAAGKLHDAVESFERRMIQATLEKFGWNKSRAAEELGLSRKGLRNKITRMALARGAGPSTAARGV